MFFLFDFISRSIYIYIHAAVVSCKCSSLFNQYWDLHQTGDASQHKYRWLQSNVYRQWYQHHSASFNIVQHHSTSVNIIQHHSTSLFIGTSLRKRVEESSLILESIHVYSACSSWHPISLAHDMAVTQMIPCKKWMLSQGDTNHLFVNLNGWNIPCGPSRFKLVYKHHSL